MAAELADAWLLRQGDNVQFNVNIMLVVSNFVDNFLAVHVLFHVVVVGSVSGSLVLVHLFGQELVDVMLQLRNLLAQVGKVLRLF